MGSIRISIAGLMALVALVAVEAASLRVAGGAGVDACRFLTVAVLMWGTTLARVRDGRAGALWFGFALAGWAAYLLVLDALDDRASGSVVSWIPLRLLEATVDRAAIGNSWAAHIRVQDQLRILHYMLVLPVAVLGGGSAWLAARSVGVAPATGPDRGAD